MLEVIRCINDNHLGVAFVVDDKKRLCGVVTDGDIRRALLEGKGLEDKIRDLVAEKDFVYAYEDTPHEELIAKISRRIFIIPIVDESMRVVDFFNFNKNIHFPVSAPCLKGNEFKYLVDAFMSTWISSTGEYVTRFEEGFSRYCDCDLGVSTSNGTTALHLALMALGIGPGDEVIVPGLTFAATINAVLHANARPVIVDIDRQSWTIDPKEIQKAVTPRTKAVIPVHLYGQPCRMDEIMEIARASRICVIEDCAEAHGATYQGRKVGSFGDVGCFSFFGNKVITTGEGGMCVTSSKALAEKMALLRDHGMSRTKRYWHDVVGYNYRLTNLQAAIGFGQLERIDEIIENRRMYEELYREVFAGDTQVIFQDNAFPDSKKITWLVSVLLNSGDRDGYIEELKKTGIDARPFFYPLGRMDPYTEYVYSDTISRDIAAKGIHLPTYSNTEQLDDVRSNMKKFLEGSSQ